ncbi:MAG: hypothetical protein H7124_17490 [Phycisphaerales bacterium]|nr:hypothetical protein [Hyphomonadaceae bacterium]
MNEADVVEQLVEFTNILMVGVSLIFSIVSAYVVALNYFIGSSNFPARFGSFVFITLILGMLVVAMIGAQTAQTGLVERLRELEGLGELTVAGRSMLHNAGTAYVGTFSGTHYSVDSIIRLCVWAGLGFVYVALAYLTFLHRWTPDVIPVTISNGPTRTQRN